MARIARLGDMASKLVCDRPFRVVGLFGLIAAVTFTAHVKRIETKIMQAVALENASQYAAGLHQLSTFYKKEVTDKLALHGVDVGDETGSEADDIPSPRALALAAGDAVVSRQSGGRIRVYSPYRATTVSPVDTPDGFVRDAWAYLTRNPLGSYHRYETVAGRPSVRYAVAELADRDCLDCRKLGLRPGDLEGVFEVVMPLSSVVMLARSGVWDTFILSLGLTGIGMLGLALLLSWLRKRTEAAQTLAAERETVNASLRSEIAQRERAECELAIANDRLTKNHSTLERWAAELEIAHARLREVDELKTKFLSEVSHELRSPMAAIVSAAKIITKHHATKPEVVERFGGTIVSEGGRMTRLINDFLDLTKVESGFVEWNDAEIDVAGLVRDATHGLDALALEHEIRLQVDAESQLPPLVADRDRLFQVLTNLANNAIKFTPPGGIVTVAVRRDGDTLRFSVDDTGPGIPIDELPKVFDRFHQVKNTRSDGTMRKGTGLGLCISREIVEHYNGRIWVESELGKGSSFVFLVPLQAKAWRASEHTDGRSPASNRQVARVLVMLDDAQLAARAAGVPAGDGIACRACADVDELRKIVPTWKPDVLVIGSTVLQRTGNQLLDAVHKLGVAKILVHSAEHGLTSPSVLDSANLLVPSLRGLVAPGARILVADDDEKYRNILEFEIRQAGYEVEAVSTGQEALDKVADSRPDAMVLDLIMPGIDGLTVLERMRNANVELPVLVYTAMDDPSVALAAKELGATEVFRKDGGGQASYAAVAARVRRVLTPVLMGAAHHHERPKSFFDA